MGVSGMVNMMGDAMFNYPIDRMVKLQGNKEHSPVWVYQYNYKHNHSLAFFDPARPGPCPRGLHALPRFRGGDGPALGGGDEVFQKIRQIPGGLHGEGSPQGGRQVRVQGVGAGGQRSALLLRAREVLRHAEGAALPAQDEVVERAPGLLEEES